MPLETTPGPGTGPFPGANLALPGLPGPGTAPKPSPRTALPAKSLVREMKLSPFVVTLSWRKTAG
jgi:hypothetical protein